MNVRPPVIVDAKNDTGRMRSSTWFIVFIGFINFSDQDYSGTSKRRVSSALCRNVFTWTAWVTLSPGRIISLSLHQEGRPALRSSPKTRLQGKYEECLFYLRRRASKLLTMSGSRDRIPRIGIPVRRTRTQGPVQTCVKGWPQIGILHKYVPAWRTKFFQPWPHG